MRIFFLFSLSVSILIYIIIKYGDLHDAKPLKSVDTMTSTW